MTHATHSRVIDSSGRLDYQTIVVFKRGASDFCFICKSRHSFNSSYDMAMTLFGDLTHRNPQRRKRAESQMRHYSTY
jgi:hypothetical protein